jgi:hypothetical protein
MREGQGDGGVLQRGFAWLTSNRLRFARCTIRFPSFALSSGDILG